MKPLIIAHRGASGYLPEHTLEAKRLAHEMGADYLEQDIVASRDDQLIVLHDIHLDRVTNVADRFPGRAREDGRFYVRDFDLDELRTLKVWERMQSNGAAVYPDRYPVRSGNFRIHPLAEEIGLVRQLNAQAGRTAGIYPEIKRPAWHREEGVDIAPILLDTLRAAGYESRHDFVYVQCFDDAELRRLKLELGCPYKLIQLIGENRSLEATTDFDALRTAQGLAELAKIVDGIGPKLQHAYELGTNDKKPVPTGLVDMAHAVGLAVHPYTFRADDLPEGFTSYPELVRFFAHTVNVDGLFTDFPDQTLRALET